MRRLILALALLLPLAAQAQNLSGASPQPQPNILLNGEMLFDQRNEGANVASSGVTAVDAWRTNYTTAGTIGGFRATAATIVCNGQQYVGDWKMTYTTGNATVNAGDNIEMFQIVEGLRIAPLGWGASTGQAVVVSLCLKSSIASASVGVGIANNALNRAYFHMCSVPSSATWTYCSFTIPADTTGTWVTTNARALRFYVMAECGSTYQGTADTWNSSELHCTSAQTQYSITSSSTLEITAVKMEIGQLTPYLHLDQATELSQLQRYYRKSFPVGVVGNFGTAPANGAAIAGAACETTQVATAQIGTKIIFSPPMNVAQQQVLTGFAPVTGTTAWYDTTAAGAASAFSVDPGSAKGNSGFNISMTSTEATIGHNLCVHWTAESGM